MFKTIEQMRVDLVAYSIGTPWRNVKGFDVDNTDLDYFPASAARVSFGNEDKTGQDPAADRKLMKYLADHEHMTPFEHQSATFLLEVPLFIRSQIMRHRTFAYNEISRRYTDENLEFWIPSSFRKQAVSNRQASSDEVVGTPHEHLIAAWRAKTGEDFEFYESLVEGGLSREQARAKLPQELLTKFFMTGNLRNWAHFVKLRIDDHAQYEVRVPAEKINAKLRELWPTAWGVLMNAPELAS